MPNLPGRYEYSMKNEREPTVLLPNEYVASERYDCPGGCGERVPVGHKCSPCAARAVREWVETRKRTK
jgi:hypothetical protein